MLTQFVAAFDDTFVFRYDKTRQAKERIDVKYVFGPKQRVMKDLNDLAKTMTLPVVTIEQTSFNRDSTRTFNKNAAFFYRNSTSGKTGEGYKIPTPVPMNMDINVSIIAKFKEDIDQIAQNFAAYFNPYIIISWKVPENFGMDFIDEIRTEVQWDGNVSYETPNSLGPDDKFKIIGNTTFTIKGWIFPQYVENSKIIYVVNTKFMAVNLQDKIYYTEDYNSLSAFDYQTDTILVSAYPQVTNTYYVYGSILSEVLDDTSLRGGVDNTFLIYGKMLDRSNTFYLSSNTTGLFTDFSLISTARFPLISGYALPESAYTVLNDNMVSITLSSGTLSSIGDFTVITANDAGWTSVPYVFNLYRLD